MRIKKMDRILLVVIVIICVSMLPSVYAHCDTMSGPVAVAAREALQTGNLETVQIWVGKEQEEELRNKFQQCLSVYQQGGEVKELAKNYFIETAIRLHRAAEGMSFTGVKPAQPLPPDIATAEKALEKQNVEIVTDLLTKELVTETQKWFEKAIQAKEHKYESIEAGREWVDAYVKYVIYVHGLHKKIKAGPKHGVGE